MFDRDIYHHQKIYFQACVTSQAVLRGLSDARELENVLPVEGCNQLFVEILGTCNQERFVCTKAEDQKDSAGN